MLLAPSTIDYAAPPAGHFWRWSREGDAIEWSTGGTLALWPEVHTILVQLNPTNGLPPLGAVLLFVAACRDDWEEVSKAFAAPLLNSILDLSSMKNSGVPHAVVANVLNHLKNVASLPRELRGSLQAKFLLAHTVFESSTVALPSREGAEILRELQAAGPLALAGPTSTHVSRNTLLREFRALLSGLKAHSAAELESLLRTGLADAELQAPDEVALPMQDTAPGSLLEALTASGGEVGSAAAIARQTIAMLGFPSHLNSPSDLPVGGIADITNRGTIDRLLPGELAWDDLTLAARLVHQEALYFRREVPPSNVLVSHTVLLSRELRLWGAGRVLSLGVALGLRHHPDLRAPGRSFECIAATADDYEYLELNTPGDVSEALKALVPLNGAARLVETWLAAAAHLDDPALPDVTLILAAESVALMPSLLGELATWLQNRGGHLRVISLERDGGLQAHAWTAGGHRLLFQGKLELPAIAPSAPAPLPPPESPAAEAKRRQDKLVYILPIYAEPVLPVAFPLSPHAAAFLSSAPDEDGFIALSTGRHLMHWLSPQFGGRILLRHLGNRTPWVSRHGKDYIIALGGGKPGDPVEAWRWDGGKRLIRIDLEKSLHSFPRDAKVSGDALILAYSDKAEALSLADGRRLAESPLSNLNRHNAFHFDGQTISVTPAAPPPTARELTWKTETARGEAMLQPERIALFNGTLWIACGEKTFLHFKPQELSWAEGSPPSQVFRSFSLSNIPGPDGELLQFAQLNDDIEVWYDTIGLLHLKLFKRQSDPWTVLLSQPMASVWSQQTGLLYASPRLNWMKYERSTTTGSQAFQDFLGSRI